MGNQNSFLPEDYLDRKIARRTNLICVGLFLVMIAAIGAAFYVQNRQDQATRAELLSVNAEFTRRAEQLRQIQELQDQQQQMIDKARVVRQLVERVPRSIILAEMVNSMPTALALTELELETSTERQPQTLDAMQRAQQQQAQAQADAAGEVQVVHRLVAIRVEGFAERQEQITVFMGNLAVHPLFTDVALDFIEEDEIENTEVQRFSITMMLNQDVLIERSGPEDLELELNQDPLADTIQINPDGTISPPESSIAETPTPTE